MVRSDKLNDSLSREGHRERMRKSFLLGDMDNSPDHNLLELFLSTVIPRKDVKELSYTLINEFGSLENVINASPEDLMKINGIGENTAVSIACIKAINKRIVKNLNNGVLKITSRKDSKEFCHNALYNETVEKVLEITLKTDGTVINSYIVSEGVVNVSAVNIRKIITNAVKDNASSVIVSHNHPDSKANPSAYDIDFTINLKSILSKMSINLIDHIIVGRDKTASIFEFADSIK